MSATPEGVGATALLTAYARAEESGRVDRLFDDPWARIFVEEATGHNGDGLPRIGMANADRASEIWEAFRAYFVGRTPFYDRHLLAAVGQGVRQVVLLAAGMDSRALRLDLPADTTVYELDTAPVLDFKNDVLARRGAEPVCTRVCVPGDLREDWAASLAAAGLRLDEPVVWVAEGLLMYFSPEQSDRLLTTITEQAGGGGSVITEYNAVPVGEDALIARTLDDVDRGAARALASIVRQGPETEPAGWLRGFGWQPEVTDIAAVIAESGRDVPPIFDVAPDRIPVWLLAGTRPAAEDSPAR